MRPLIAAAAMLLSTAVVAQETDTRQCSVTYDKFRKIRQAAPYGQIKGYLHCEGELVASERIGTRNMKTYRFAGEKPGSFALVRFSDNLVFDTFQNGLQ